MRRRPRWLIALAATALFAATAAAQAPALPRRSALVASAHYNLHMAGDRGAQGESSQSRVELRATSERITVTDAGESREYVSDAGGRSDATVLRWSHRWTGRLVRDGEALRLELRVAATSCQRERSSQGAVVSTEACDGQVDLTLRCTASDDPRGWSCSSADAPPRTGTPGPWMFAPGTGCIERSGGAPMTGPMRHGPCAPE